MTEDRRVEIRRLVRTVRNEMHQYRPVLDREGNLSLEECFTYFDVLQQHRSKLREAVLEAEVWYLENYQHFVLTDEYKLVKNSSTLSEKLFHSTYPERWGMVKSIQLLIDDIDGTLREYTSLLAFARENLNKGLITPKNTR